MVVNIDFDGTVVTHDYPAIGKDIGSVKVLKRLIVEGHQLILFTMRSDSPDFAGLTEAVNWFKEKGLPLFGVQTNPSQSKWTTSPKSYAPLMIDDSALGCPMKRDLQLSDRPFVDWEIAEKLLEERGILTAKSKRND